MSDYVQLTKPRLNLLVVFTTGVGYWLGVAGHVDAATMFHAVVGTALVAGGSAVFNQLYEQDVDALMSRTRLRPLPDGRLAPWHAFLLGPVLRARPGAAVVRRQPPERGRGICDPPVTVVHAHEAAIVAVDHRRGDSGRVAAGDRLGRGHRHGFARGVAPVRDRLPVADAALPLAGVAVPRGIRTSRVPGVAGRGADGPQYARQTVIYTAALIPVSLGPALIGLAGPVYFAVALVLGIAFLALAVRFSRDLPAHRAPAVPRIPDLSAADLAVHDRDAGALSRDRGSGIGSRESGVGDTRLHGGGQHADPQAISHKP